MRTRFEKAAQKLHAFPLASCALNALTCLDLANQNEAPIGFTSLGKMLPNILPNEERGRLDIETWKYNVDKDFRDMHILYVAKVNKRWWAPRLQQVKSILC